MPNEETVRTLGSMYWIRIVVAALLLGTGIMNVLASFDPAVHGASLIEGLIAIGIAVLLWSVGKDKPVKVPDATEKSER